MRGDDPAVRNLRPRNGSGCAGEAAEQDGGAGQAVSAGRAGAGGPRRAGGSARGDLGPALRAAASDGKLLPRGSLVPDVRRTASLCWPDFKTVFIKKQAEGKQQAGA